MFNKIQEQFEKNKFYVYDDFLSKDECKELSDKFFYTLKNNKDRLQKEGPRSKQVKNSHEIYTPFPEIGVLCLDKIEKITGVRLGFTYCYSRLYKKGSDLKPHIDRSASEYSVTIPLAFSEQNDWPIKFRDVESNTYNECVQDIGNGIVYMGEKLWHWRPSLPIDWSLHLFLHYVDINGKHKDLENEYKKHKDLRSII